MPDKNEHPDIQEALPDLFTAVLNPSEQDIKKLKEEQLRAQIQDTGQEILRNNRSIFRPNNPK